MADTQNAGPPPSAWSPLAVPAFRTVWTATLVANIGAWVASVGTGWLMTTLDPSPIWVSLVGAATALPMFLFALPAGALADIVDRRKLLIVAQIFMLAVMVVLCALTVMGAVTPITLLILIFVLEAGSAFETPAFLAVLPQLVPKNELGPALALNGLGINISRVIGPALGGLVIGLAGVGATFLINALTFFAVIFAYASWRPPAHTSHLPAERFTAAIRSGWRFTREAPALKATLVHAGTFFLFASAYWALLPLIARDQLRGGAHVYGMLFGAIGAGAVAGALVLPAIRGRLSPDRLVLGGGLVTAAATAALAATHTLALAMPIMLVIGAAWLAVMSSLMVAAQVALPEWVKARGLAVTQMVFNGGLMFGSVLWGVVADQWGIPWALVLSAGGLAAASVATLRWRLPGDDSLDLRPSRHWPAPVVKETLPGDRGPVLVTVEYTVASEDRGAFAAALAANAHVRRRDGAIYWHHFIDTADPRRHLEVFVVESWLEHMRQHERVTRADLASRPRCGNSTSVRTRRSCRISSARPRWNDGWRRLCRRRRRPHAKPVFHRHCRARPGNPSSLDEWLPSMDARVKPGHDNSGDGHKCEVPHTGGRRLDLWWRSRRAIDDGGRSPTMALWAFPPSTWPRGSGLRGLFRFGVSRKTIAALTRAKKQRAGPEAGARISSAPVDSNP